MNGENAEVNSIYGGTITGIVTSTDGGGRPQEIRYNGRTWVWNNGTYRPKDDSE